MSDKAALSKERIKPLFIVKPKTMSRRDIKRVEKLTGLCIIECAEPESCRLLEPPVDAGIDVQAKAALSLMRYIINDVTVSNTNGSYYKATLIMRFVDAIVNASRPAPVAGVKSVKK